MSASRFNPSMWRAGLVPALAILVTLSGCSTHNDVRRLSRDAEPQVYERYRTAAQPVTSSSTFEVDTGFYAAKKPISVTPVNPALALPSTFSKPATMNIQSPTGLNEIAARITKMSGYQVSIDRDVLTAGGGSTAAPARAAAPLPSDPSSPPSSLPPLPSPTFAPTPMSVSNDLVLNEVLFNGNLAGLLDAVTGQLALSWRWTGSKIEVYRYETRMFRFNALAGDTKTSANLDTTTSALGGGAGGSSGGSSSGGTKGSSGQTTSVSSSMEVWKDVEDAIKNSLTDGGKLSMTPSAGIITVRDTPQALRQVEAQISEFNRIYSRQVMLNVEVYAISRSAADTAAVDWNLVWKTAASRYGGLNIGTGGSAAGSPNSFTLDVKNGPWTGSSVVASVLSTVGNTTLLTSAPVTTLNGQTVPLNISRDQAYVASFSTTLGGGTTGGSTTTITPGVVSEGFSMNVTPRILEDNNVVIRYAVDLSTIEGIQEFVSPDGQSAIQLPRRAVRNFLQNVNVRSGQTLVLTGFQQITGQSDNSGPLGAGSWFLGGKKQSTATARTLVIVITPYVLQ